MSKLPIIIVPNPKLRVKSEPVTVRTPKIVKFIQNLEETLRKKTDPPGVGLSAIQVAEPLRIFSLYLPPDYKKTESPKLEKTFTIKTYINPEIIDQSDQLTLGPNPKRPIMEGCLSIPDIYGPVLRHEWIQLKYYTLLRPSEASGEGGSPELIENTTHLYGFTARVAQHEQDHLDGILFTDRSITQHQPLYEEQNGELIQIKLG